MAPAEDPAAQITALLQNTEISSSEVAERLMPLMYDQLRALARSMMAKLPPGQTLETTALVHEAYVKVVSGKECSWENRRHFFATAAQAMRFILVDQARRKSSEKHGGKFDRQSLEGVSLQTNLPHEDMLALNEALERLEKEDERKARIVMLRYFAGLSESETAETLGVSRATVARDWRYIRAWLHGQLSGSDGEDT